MSTDERRTLFKTCVVSKFNYCPLVKMFHIKELNNRINSEHDFVSISEEKFVFRLITKTWRISSHAQQKFSIFVNRYIKLKWDCNLRCGVTVTGRNIRTSKFGVEAVSTIGVVLWGNLPNDTKNSDSLNIFIYKIKQWTSDNCPCEICRYCWFISNNFSFDILLFSCVFFLLQSPHKQIVCSIMEIN